jgi:hypothetical protein
VKSIKRSNDFDQKRKQLIEQVRMNPSDNLEGRELQNFTKDPVLTYVLTLSPRNFGTIEEGLIFFKKGFAKLDKAINTKADRCGNKLAKYALSQLKEGFLGSMRKIEVEHSLSEDGKLNIHSHLVLLMKNAGVDKYTLDFKSFYQLVSWAFGENMQVHFGTKRNEQTGDNSHRPLRCGKETSKAVYEVCKYITKMPTAGKESPEEIEAQQALIWETTALASKYKLFQLTGRIAKVKIKKETKLDMRRPKSAFHQDLTNHDGDTGYSQYTYPVKKNLLKPAIFERLQIKDLLKDLKHSHESRLDMINRGEYSAKSLKKKDARIKGLETRKANLEQIISDTEEAIQARNEATKATFVHVSYNNQDKNDSGVSETPESIAQNKQKLDDLVKLCEGNTSDPNELPL